MPVHRRLLQIFSIALIITILFSGFALPSAYAQTGTSWYVATTGNDSNSCSSAGSPCATINGAIAKATAGDTIQVAIGTYTGTGTEIVPINKNITLSGGWDASFTTQSGKSTIDGQAARRGIEVWGGAVVTIEYFNVQNGLECGGGGISNSYGSALTLNQSLISNNDSRCTGTGAGIDNNGTMAINNSTIKDNDGGGIDSIGLLTVNNSTISGNVSRAGAGAGLANQGTATINNSTVSGNTSWDNGGGGIANESGGQLILNNSTVVGNNAFRSNGGGLLNDGTVTMRNTILALNMATSYPGNILTSSDCMGGRFGNYRPCELTSEGYNLIGNNSTISFSAATGDLVGTNINPIDPRLMPLQDNGGPTFTHALLSDSLALNAGNPTVPGSGGNACLATDQRGVTRPYGSQCDIGAYEEDGTTGYLTISGNTVVRDVTLSYINGTPKTVKSDQVGNYSIRVPAGWSGTVTPSKVDFIFTPANRTYNNIQIDQTNQDYAVQGFVQGADTTGVFRPSNGLLYLKNSNVSGFADVALNYGLPGDYPVVGDWDGNSTVTIGIYRGNTFYLRNENTIGFAEIVFDFGQVGDQPIAGDWNGDGVDTIGVFRPSNGNFLLRDSNTAGPAEMSFFLGNPGDVGVAGDWNGDGKDTTGVFRPANGLIYLKDQNTTGFADYALNYGLPGDKPVMGDWNNDGIDTIGIYRNGSFYLRNENTIGFAELIFALGNPGDMPIAGNWDALP